MNAPAGWRKIGTSNDYGSPRKEAIWNWRLIGFSVQRLSSGCTQEKRLDIRQEIENQGHVIRILTLQLLNEFEMKLRVKWSCMTGINPFENPPKPEGKVHNQRMHMLGMCPQITQGESITFIWKWQTLCAAENIRANWQIQHSPIGWVSEWKTIWAQVKVIAQYFGKYTFLQRVRREDWYHCHTHSVWSC